MQDGIITARLQIQVSEIRSMRLSMQERQYRWSQEMPSIVSLWAVLRTMADGMPTEVRSMALAQTGAQIVCQIFAAACVRQVCAEVASCHAFSAFKMLFIKN